MVNCDTADQENLVDPRTYPQITPADLPEALAARLPLVAANSQTFAHPPLFTVHDGAQFRDGLPGVGCKNLFLKDKKGTLWLVTARDDARIDLTAFSAFLRDRRAAASRLSFGVPALLHEVLGVTPGSVTPLALVNDHERRVNFALDASLLTPALISCHPLRNDMTTVLPPLILYKTLIDLGYRPLVIDFSQSQPRSVEAPVL